ncbi:hypothetical protein AVT65_gp79 [Gordonia phage Gmala1]|uniref:Uncharacterized protein n=2 Tax=Gordtnkvirus gordtnk2 TaxID=1982219 RepID=A0A0E3XBG6_9CAUD|nr:hypothetical protein AVT65_gp79 [Gordonia phage Gmala1]YP_009223994.1 hypothetical protein AXJ10_gp86 [Gordonia phage GordTnk2]AKC02826.1 hypothetical protein GordTnk2_86 [Gordonia phage GordTnk2]AKC02917.1 hypothetical protein Gmala1_79 [Gordonia phage Gmala1]
MATEKITVTTEEANLISKTVPLSEILIKGTRDLNPASGFYEEAVKFVKWYRDGGKEIIAEQPR